MPTITILCTSPKENYEVPRKGFCGNLMTKIVKTYEKDSNDVGDKKYVTKYWKF